MGKYLVLFLGVWSNLFSNGLAVQVEDVKPKTICLNMIVKNEKAVILRSLASSKGLIDYWVIVDTGSTDGTQDLVKEYLKDIPGELHEQPWVNFGHNRNEALKLAKSKADYVLFVDADERIELSPSFSKKDLNADTYFALVHIDKEKTHSFRRVLLINNKLDWSWRGVLHEKLDCSQSTSNVLLSDTFVFADTTDGQRSLDPKKHLKDAQTLEDALINDPNNSDYVYYLAQSYFNAQEYALSLANYEKRSRMEGWDQGKFWSMYMMGRLQEMLGKSSDQILDSYSKAYTFRPTRIEPVYRMAYKFLDLGLPLVAYTLTKSVLDTPLPTDFIYVESDIYEYELLILFSYSAQLIGRHSEAYEGFKRLIENKKLPQERRGIVQKHMKEALEAMKGSKSS